MEIWILTNLEKPRNAWTKSEITPTNILPNIETLPYFMEFYQKWRTSNIKLDSLQFFNQLIIALIRQAHFSSNQKHVCVWFDDIYVEPSDVETVEQTLQNEEFTGIRNYEYRYKPAFGGLFAYDKTRVRPPQHFEYLHYAQPYVYWTYIEASNLNYKDLTNIIKWRHEP